MGRVLFQGIRGHFSLFLVIMKYARPQLSNNPITFLLVFVFSCNFDGIGALQPLLLSYALQTNYETCAPEQIISNSASIMDSKNDVRVGGFSQVVSAPGWADITEVIFEETSEYLNIRISLDSLEDTLLIAPGEGRPSVFIGSRIHTSNESVLVGILNFGESTMIRRNWNDVTVQVILNETVIGSCGVPWRIGNTLEFKCDPKLWNGWALGDFTGVTGETMYKYAGAEYRDCAGGLP